MSPISNRKLQIKVNGKAYTVEVGSLAESPINVTVNGQPYVVEINNDAVTNVTRAESPPALQNSTRTVSAASPVAPASISPAAANAKTIIAPMPGEIVELFVQPGDQVSAGQELCSLEAMKMKNAIRSPREGTIAAVEVQTGQKVAHGTVLVTFE